MFGNDLALEPRLGVRPVRPVQPLIGAKRSRDWPGPSHSADSPTAAPPLKRVKMCEMEIQTL